ncbi:hypothetical protein EAF00_001122 [Botryotinia globosa]|nr:hypothetical protein EAF00_001122 [Botryotinia globosa]
MSPINLVLRTAFILSSISTSFAAVCNDQTRASGDPSGETLAAFLNSQDQISQFCSVDVSGKTSGNVNFSDFQISFERSDSSSSTLEHCTQALQDIIRQCIEPSDPGTYGGSSTFESGGTYTISNDLYPQVPRFSMNLESREVAEAAKRKLKPPKTTAEPTTAEPTPKTTVAQETTSPKSQSLASSSTPEITPAPSSPSTSELNPSIPETASTSQVISTGSFTPPVVPVIIPIPLPPLLGTPGLSQPIETFGPVESLDPIETSQSETPESNSTETAIPSSISAPLSTSIASSPACTATTGGNCSTCYQYSGCGDISLSLSNSTTFQSRQLPPSIAGPNLSYEDASTLFSKAGTQTEYWYVLEDTPVNATTCSALGFTKVTDAALASFSIDKFKCGWVYEGWIRNWLESECP